MSVEQPQHISSAAMEAWNQSALAELPPAAAETLLATSWQAHLPAGKVFYRGAFHTDMAFLGIVIDGLLRTFMNAPNGRQVTIRYAGEGAFIGAPAILLEGTDVSSDALFDTDVLRLNPQTFRALAQRDAAVAWTVARFLARQESEIREMLASAVFMDIRSRVARHLLDLSVREVSSMVVYASHQDIADAIGSVREVVSRVIKRMQEDGLIGREGSRMIIRDPSGLHAIAGGVERIPIAED
jgi:CRP/FNR family transcriptional regulator